MSSNIDELLSLASESKDTRFEQLEEKISTAFRRIEEVESRSKKFAVLAANISSEMQSEVEDLRKTIELATKHLSGQPIVINTGNQHTQNNDGPGQQVGENKGNING